MYGRARDVFVWVVVGCGLATTSHARGGGHSGGSHSHSSGGGSHYVAPHTTKNGTYVPGHYQTNPNGSKADNWSTKGNVNPHTGETGTVDPTSGGLGRSVAPADPPTPAPARSVLVEEPAPIVQPTPRPSRSIETLRRDTARDQGTRSRAMRSAFMHQHPCPSTGKATGACPGYVVDHITPLCANGADLPSNMQWQSVQAAKSKDATERAACASRH